jgi:hypothetical protein
MTASSEGAPSASMTSRSKPNAFPPEGGIPSSSAVRNRSSIGYTGSPRARALRPVPLEARALLAPVGELAEAVAQLHAAGIELEALGEARVVGARSRE